MDILYKNESYIFSYRVGGILIQNGKLLLQRPVHGYSILLPLEKRDLSVKYNSSRKRMQPDKKEIMDNR